MIFITGPLFSGKHTFAAGLSGRQIANVQELAAQSPDISVLASELAEQYDVILATEVGGGVVPVDKAEREARENAGRLACALAERADTVVRMCCGIPEILKGKLPE